MKRRWKRFLSGVMTAVMLLGMLPTSAYAAVSQLVRNTSLENAALLAALEEIYGDDAEAYLAVLRQYGLVDEKGNLVTDEKIVVDGVEYTLAELEEYLKQPGLDMSKVAAVDGQSISLEDLQTVLEIEQYLAELKAKYFTPQQLNDQQVASFYDLADAISRGQMQFLAAGAPLTGVGPAGVDHSARLTVTTPGDTAPEKTSDGNSGTYTFTVTASNFASTKPVTFSWRAVSGSAAVSGGGTNVSIKSGESLDLTVTVDAVRRAGDNSQVKYAGVQGEATFLVQIYDVKNALLSNGTTCWEQKVTVESKDEFCYYYSFNEPYETPGSYDYSMEYSLLNFNYGEERRTYLGKGRWKYNPSFTPMKEDNAVLSPGHYGITVYQDPRKIQMGRLDRNEYADQVEMYDASTENFSRDDVSALTSYWNNNDTNSVFYNYPYNRSDRALSRHWMAEKSLPDSVTDEYVRGRYTVYDWKITCSNSFAKPLSENGYGIGLDIPDFELYLTEAPPVGRENKIFYYLIRAKEYANAYPAEVFFNKQEISLGDAALSPVYFTKSLSRQTNELSEELTVLGGTSSHYHELKNVTDGSQVMEAEIDWSARTDPIYLLLKSQKVGEDKVTAEFTYKRPPVLSTQLQGVLPFKTMDIPQYPPQSTWEFVNYEKFTFAPKLHYEYDVTFSDVTNTANVTLSAPAGTYYAGQSVPITAVFDYPMTIDNRLKLVVNKEELTPVETGTVGDSCTFLYPVTSKSLQKLTINDIAFVGVGASSKAQGANRRDMTISLTADSLQQAATNENITMVPLKRADAFADYQVDVVNDTETNQPVLKVTVPLSQTKELTTWVLNELVENDNTVSSLKVQLADGMAADGKTHFTFTGDGDHNVTALVAEIPLQYNAGTKDLDGVVDFLLDGQVIMGAGRTYKVAGSKPVPGGDMEPTLTVTTGPADEGTSYKPKDEIPVLYAEQGNGLYLKFGLTGTDYTWGNPNKVSYYNAEGKLVDETAHFAWQSSNTAVAIVEIDDNVVKLTPKGEPGKTTVKLIALNGSLGKTESEGIEVEFAVGTDPFLIIPASGKTVAIRQGQDATVSWTSNICQKNKTGGAEGAFTPTTFDVRLSYKDKEGDHVITKAELPKAVQDALTTQPDETDLDTGEVVNQRSIISSVTLPWNGLLDGIYAKDVRELTVEVSVRYLNETFGTYDNGNGDSANNATAKITMTSRPAAVELDLPAGGLYQVDWGDGLEIDLTWTVEDLDVMGGDGRFELYITRDGWNGTITETELKADGVTKTGKDEYKYKFKVPKVMLDPNDPTSYRDSYSITVKAKNKAEPTWSSSSYVLYVYSNDALQIMLDGEPAKGDLTMSNRTDIAKLWGDGGEDGSNNIVDLQRDIALKNVISANYGDYAWAELADQIAWESSNTNVATVNYQQGTLYENIEHFSYTSYRPTTDFILSGLQNGETTVTARHVNTNLTKSLDVKVETLRDKLYLFQCYPKKETVLTYSTWLDDKKTKKSPATPLHTNGFGEAAIYAPYGIAGDVYCKSEFKEGEQDVTYLGTIYNRNLVSSEADSTKLQLYPVNTLQLRRAAQAVIYLKNPDGTPYAEKEVTFRGGVYRDGVYCTGDSGEQEVRFGLQDEDSIDWEEGNKDHSATTDQYGALTVTMDVSSFKHKDNQEEVGAGDRMYYLFQLEGENKNYYPLFLRMDATMNIKDVAATGSSIMTWEKNASGTENPFVAQQTLKYNQSASASVANVRKSTGKVGPSETFPEAWLTSTVMWWGMEGADPGRTITLQDTTGKVPAGQTSKIVTYPFTELSFTEHVMKLDKSTMDSWGIASGDERAVRLALSEDGTTTSRTISLPFHVVNLLGVPKAEKDGSLTDAANEIKDKTSVSGVDMPTGDFLINMGLSLVASDAEYDGSTNGCAIRLYATSDPTVFRALFSLSAGNMSSDDNATGVYPAYTNTEDMAFAEQSDSDLDLMPTPMNMYRMITGTYKDSLDDEHKDAMDGKGVAGYSFDAGGYFEADITYNTQAKKWECRPVAGGFHVGGGINYNWYVNLMVGPVPVAISLTLGGTLEIGMDMQRGTYYQVNSGMDNLKGADREDAFNNALKQAQYIEKTGNDYLTRLRIFLYIRAFAGVGFDISILAFKVGIFGQLNLDLNFQFLNRDYLGTDNPNHISAVGPTDTRQTSYLNGQKLLFSGSTGVEFVFKFLFVSYEKVFCSWGFQLGGTTNKWEEIQDIWAANKKINNAPIGRMLMPNGDVMYTVDMGPQLESRDYVDIEDQEWVGGRPSIGLFNFGLDQDPALADELQTGAYSYANPVLSDDGQFMFYLSDRIGNDPKTAEDVTNTRVAVSTKSLFDKFQQGTRFDTPTEDVPVGFGDSNVKLAGKKDRYAAAWVRQMEDFTPAKGDGALTEGDQRLQMNSTEIVAAIYKSNNKWELTRLTDNTSPDLAPVVATNGTRTIVAWREVNSSDVDSLTSFDQRDAIRYAICEDGKWETDENDDIKVQTLYDGLGTNASVKGLEMAMLTDGTAAVVYTLDTDTANDSNTDWETVAALIPTMDKADQTETQGDEEPESSEDTVRTFRLTNDRDLDENPQIATAKFGTGTSAVERFVIAWHTERAISDPGAQSDAQRSAQPQTGTETQSDIRLAAMDKNGALYENMPESLGRATEGTGEAVGSNFRLAKNADSINDLSILWADSVSPAETDPTRYADPSQNDKDEAYKNELASAIKGGYGKVGHDVLKAVRFVENDRSFTLSGTVEVAEMEQDTLIDHFDAYVNKNKEIKSVILGTNYDNEVEKTVTISDGTEEGTYNATMKVANPVTRMYTATAEFTNRIEMPAVMLEYDKLFPNGDADVQFTIRNSGKAAITKLEILSDGKKVYDSKPADDSPELNLLPNRDITVTAKFPIRETVENAGYTIQATFEGDSDPVELSDTLYLDIPDVGISGAQVVEEANGNRVVSYSLYNALSAKLGDKKNDWRVQVGFYADQDCTKPLKGEFGVQDEIGSLDTLDNLVLIIDDKDDLALIDNGGYSGAVTLPVGQYLDEDSEIPTTGIPVYIKAWVEEGKAPVMSRLRTNTETQYTPIAEYNDSNNSTSLLLDNLAYRRGEDVSIDAELDNSDGGTTVTVNLRYNKRASTESGNLIVTLFDANGKPIDRKQLSNDENKLLKLTNEARPDPMEFKFAEKGEYVQVEFVDQVLDEPNTELYKVGLTGAKITYVPKDPKDPENTEGLTGLYIATGTNLTSGILDILPVDPEARILVNGEPYTVKEVPERIDLSLHETVWFIDVTSTGPDEIRSTTAKYKLVLTNEEVATSGGGSGGGGGGGGLAGYPVETAKETEHGTVTVQPAQAQKGDIVTVTAKPDEGYEVGKITVTQPDGQTVSVTKKPDGTYTFTMPDGKVSVDVTFVPKGQWVNPFTDVTENDWYFDAVRYVNENGLMAGTSANTFSPDITTTRGMIVTMLYRLEGSPDMKNEIWGYPFKDVDANAYYGTAVYWARMHGIVTGYSDELFGPNDTITREQMAAILYRYAQYKGYDTAGQADLSGYTDADQISVWALDPIAWANLEGLIRGTSNTILSPRGSATRSQVAVILTRFCQNIVK